MQICTPFLLIRMQLSEILETLNTIAPFEAALDWDNIGIMVGDPDQEIRSILVALDPSLEVIHHARAHGNDLILTHHPLFFEPLKTLNLKHGPAHKAALLIQSKMALVSMHTNLDTAVDGVADVLAASLGLRGLRAVGMLRCGVVDPQPLDAWVRSLPFQGIRICSAGKGVAAVSVCPGSGMDLWPEALKAGCDTLVTGDVRYHRALEATEAGLNIVDLGHYGSEAVIVKPLTERLRTMLPAVECTAFEGANIFISIG